MSSDYDMEKGVRITEIQCGGQLQSIELDSMLKTLEGMEKKIHSFFEGINNDIRLLDREVNEKSNKIQSICEVNPPKIW